jgi:predicted ATPase
MSGIGAHLGQATSPPDIGVAFMNYLAWAIWPLGEFDCARQLEEAAIARAHSVGHIATLVYAEFWKALLEILRDDVDRAAPHAVKTLELAREHGLQMFSALGIALNGWVRAAQGELEAGIAEMRQGISAFHDQGLRLITPALDSLLATLEAEGGAIDAALARLDQAFVEVEHTGQRWYEAEMHRIRGEILLRRDLANTSSAEDAFLTAIAIAQRQKARSFLLRAALALATLYQATNRGADALAVLGPALKGFSPTPEFPEIGEAQTLLATLSP